MNETFTSLIKSAAKAADGSKMGFRNLPAIITLISGLVACIITLIYQYPINQALWILIIVMVVFYIIGMIIRKIFNKTFENQNHTEENENNNTESELDTDSVEE